MSWVSCLSCSLSFLEFYPSEENSRGVHVSRVFRADFHVRPLLLTRLPRFPCLSILRSRTKASLAINDCLRRSPVSHHPLLSTLSTLPPVPSLRAPCTLLFFSSPTHPYVLVPPPPPAFTPPPPLSLTDYPPLPPPRPPRLHSPFYAPSPPVHLSPLKSTSFRVFFRSWREIRPKEEFRTFCK